MNKKWAVKRITLNLASVESEKLERYCAMTGRPATDVIRESILYKIGVTTRPIQQQLVEIEADLLDHYKTVEIQILGTWTHRGNVELYFKHRYQNFNYRIGSLTEYFKFNPSDANAILSELHGMKAKVLSPVEIDILKDNISLSQVAI